jgi:hypothetical protein
MYIEFWFTLANVYKVFARTGSMYMEFWLAPSNVYKVLMATIEHPTLRQGSLACSSLMLNRLKVISTVGAERPHCQSVRGQ